MKNIHILSTDQPSRLHYYFYMSKEYTLSKEPLNWRTASHIYITSNEEIKDGDWMIRGNEQPTLVTSNFFWDFGVRYYKIILTTDPALIADSIQSIDGNFLEWFVKNPTCEFVEVKYIKTPDAIFRDRDVPYGYYKLIIPQEEPKQYPIGGYAPGFYSCKCVNCKIEFTGDKRAVQCKPCAIKMTQEETKQDLEEAAEIYAEYQLKGMADKSSKFECVNDFISGAKWQAERSYSEEEVYKLLKTYQSSYSYANNEIGLKKWFEDLKKKVK